MKAVSKSCNQRPKSQVNVRRKMALWLIFNQNPFIHVDWLSLNLSLLLWLLCYANPPNLIHYEHVTHSVGSAKYPVFNQHQLWSHRAHAHKLLDCSHIHQQHSTASTAQPARISSELSARRRWQSKESTGAMISEETYKLRDELTIVWHAIRIGDIKWWPIHKRVKMAKWLHFDCKKAVVAKFLLCLAFCCFCLGLRRLWVNKRKEFHKCDW